MAPEAALELSGLTADDQSLAILKTLAETDRWLAEDHEIAAILRALDGRFIRPAPAGDLMRTPAILPTGRNLHGFDPFRIPSAFAVQDGARQAERIIARHQADGQHASPQSAHINSPERQADYADLAPAGQRLH